MSLENCAPGQRWISNTEPELGLGITYEVENRRVVVTFPAGDERRTYALDNAPLTRVRYRIADRVRSEDGTEIIVSAIEEINECLVYQGVNAAGEQTSIHEIDLDSFVQFNRPLDRLFTGQIDRPSRFNLRASTLEHHHRQLRSPVFGLLGPRVQLLGHQFYIADTVANRHAPRVLLADEVGLGKTIEAGLVMHRMLLSGRVTRVLIVVPDNLVHQWLVEMLRRFNLQFSILDGEIVEELEASGETNPFESAQLALVPLDFLAGDANRLEQAVRAGWDLMIVDEAHHLRWSENDISPGYHAVAELAAVTGGLLLLTATPEQLGVSGHFARLALLDPHRYNDLDQYLAEEQRYASVSELVRQLLDNDQAPDTPALSAAAEFLGEERLADFDSNDQAARGALVSELLDRHGTGRVLFRNRRDNIAGFPARELHRYLLDAPPGYLGGDDPAAMLTPETGLGDLWLERDPRADWLAEWLREHAREKALVICAHAETAQSLETWLRVRRGARSAVFHEDMDLVQRDRAAAYFADAEEDAQVLVCSEIGSEGRNFQFAHHLVLFDLPLNPDLLEQRIGRLDRIGQRSTVAIHAPVFADSASAVLLSWLHEGIDACEHICPAGPALFAEFQPRLDACMRAPQDSAALSALVDDSRRRAGEIRSLLREGRDRLLELNSFDQNRAGAIIHEIEQASQVDALGGYMDRVFDAFGVEHEDHGAMSLVVQPGDHMRCEAFPGLPDGGVTITFDRDEAQTRDDMQFLTWEHPMVTGAIDMILGSEFGNAAFGVIKGAGLEPGTILVECLFVLVCPAPRGLNVDRYLPQSILRAVINNRGEDVTGKINSVRLGELITDVPAATASKVVSRMRDTIEQLADHATHVCEVQQESIVNEALSAMRQDLDQEISRLEALARVNPNIRGDEVAALAQERDAAERYLRGAQLKLDAVRVAIAT